MPATTDGCRCATCAGIHADFIATFGRWPTMSHDDALALQDRRDRAEASWDRMTAGMRP